MKIIYFSYFQKSSLWFKISCYCETGDCKTLMKKKQTNKEHDIE